jgi:hypothetical protein
MVCVFVYPLDLPEWGEGLSELAPSVLNLVLYDG